MNAISINLGGVAYDVPPLPLRHNRVVYPLCRKLVGADLLTRCFESGGELAATPDEMDDLITIAVHVRQACDPAVTREEVEAVQITPPELLDMFFHVRYLTGAWLLPDAGNLDQSEKTPSQSEPKGQRQDSRRSRK